MYLIIEAQEMFVSYLICVLGFTVDCIVENKKEKDNKLILVII